MGIYVGKGNQTPIYTTVERQDNLCYANYEEYFSSYDFSGYFVSNSNLTYLNYFSHVFDDTSTTEQIALFVLADNVSNLSINIFKPGGVITDWRETMERWTIKLYVNSSLRNSYVFTKGIEEESIDWDLSDTVSGDEIKITMNRPSTDTITYSSNRISVKLMANRSYTEQEITGYETIPAVKSVTDIYTGKAGEVPVYTETTTTEDIALSSATFTDFFSADNTGTTGTNAKGITWADNSGGGLKLTFGNYKIDSSTSMTTFTAQRDLTNVVIKGLYYTESNFDKITLTVAGSTVLNAVSGTSSTLTQRWTGSLTKGQTIVLKYVKDNVGNATNESSTYFTLSCDSYQKTTTTQIQTGTETKLVDKKIVKGYVGVNGIAKLFFNKANGISYTGEYTVSDVSISGINYKLYTLTTSGSLTVNGESQYWICGGGASGNYAYSLPMSGGTNGGGGGYTATGILNAGAYNVTIGAGGQGSSDSSSDGNITSIGGAITANGGKYLTAEGGSGGGEGVASFLGPWTGTGSGISTIPFGIESLNPHCAGGGGGSYYSSSSSTTTRYTGGAGGTNGGNGANMKTVSFGNQKKGIGGSYGGGDGGEYISSNNNTKATSATFYGGGGGGSYYHKNSSSTTKIGSPGNGYQGVAYVLVPA